MSQNQDSEELDTWNLAIQKTGCFQENEDLQLCYADNGRDWRKCKQEMERFRTCMERYQREKELQEKKDGK